MRALLSLLLPVALSVGCSSKAPAAGSTTPPPDAGPTATAPDASPASLLAARPYTLVLPTNYDPSTPAPLVFMLHGYSASGALEEAYMDLTAAANAHGFLYAYADGTVDSSGNRFWNATDACCNFDHNPVDDVAYIDAILADVASKHSVDPKRVFLVGHSNGGFMAHVYACDRADKIAAIVSLAGAQWEDASRCTPSGPVSVAEVHGDQDTTIAYDGGTTMDNAGKTATYPSAHQTVATWASKDGCTGSLAQVDSIDLDQKIAGAETERDDYGGCPGTSAVQLWTIHGAGHIPDLGTSWGEYVWTFLSAHAKP